MAGNSAFQFSSPGTYGDWATYAGFDRNTGEIGGMQPPSGIAPPENFQDYMKQRLDPAQNKISAIAPAMQQASQGNFSKAAGMIRSPAAPQIPSIQQPSVTTAPMQYDYTHGLDQ
jgi:hypothetical protein